MLDALSDLERLPGSLGLVPASYYQTNHLLGSLLFGVMSAECSTHAQLY